MLFVRVNFSSCRSFVIAMLMIMMWCNIDVVVSSRDVTYYQFSSIDDASPCQLPQLNSEIWWRLSSSGRPRTDDTLSLMHSSIDIANYCLSVCLCSTEKWMLWNIFFFCQHTVCTSTRPKRTFPSPPSGPSPPFPVTSGWGLEVSSELSPPLKNSSKFNV